jgi:hypothetical protein
VMRPPGWQHVIRQTHDIIDPVCVQPRAGRAAAEPTYLNK